MKMAGEFLRFGFVGLCNTVLDFTVYYVLTRNFLFWGDHVVAAAAVSFCVAVASSFFLNNFWTFRRDAQSLHHRSVKFFIVALAGLAWNSAILYGLISAGLHDILAKLAATAVVMMWNFILQKTWTFRGEK